MTKPLTEDELAAIEARANAATPGLWECFPAGERHGSLWYFGPKRGGWKDARAPEPDASFVANAREDVPRLVEEIRRLRELLMPLKQADSRANVRRRRGRAPAEAFPQFAGQTKSCPRCNRVGDIVEEFGIRRSRGKDIPSSWCRKCRSDAAR